MTKQVLWAERRPDVAEAVVRFEEVALRYGRGPEVLRGIDLALAPGSFHFLTGSSGAGKSSLLGLMYLALRPSRGVVRLFGTDPARAPHSALPAIRRRIGVVFQDFRLLEHLSAFDNVALPLRVSGTPEQEIRDNVGEMLHWVGLGDALHARPSTLSGGQQQRVAIARAVVGRPELLVADEPTGSVDEQTAFRLMRLFEELHKMGTTVVVATHNPYLVETFGHPALHLENGMVERRPGRYGN